MSASKLRKSFKRSLSHGDGDIDFGEDSSESIPIPTRSVKRRSSIFASAWNILTRQNKKKKSDSIGSVISEPEDDVQYDSDADTASSFSNQKQQDAWLQACYNAVAFLFFFITGCVVLAVYYILEPFLHPLLWAVLFGMVFHPFKHGSTSQIKQWLTSLDSNGIPLSIGLLFSPFVFFNWMTQYFEYIFISSWKTIAALVVCIVSLFLAYVLNLSTYVSTGIELLSRLFALINEIMSQTAFLQVSLYVDVPYFVQCDDNFMYFAGNLPCIWFHRAYSTSL